MLLPWLAGCMCGEKIGWFLSGILQGGCSTDRVGCGCSVSGRGGRARVCSKTGGEMILFSQRFSIVAVMLDRCLDVIDYVISGI